MTEFFTNYGLFLLKIATVVVAVLVVFAGAVAMRSGKSKQHKHGSIEATLLNEQFKDYKDDLNRVLLDEATLKAQEKNKKAQEKAKRKADKKKAKIQAKDSNTQDSEQDRKQRVYVLDFDGDIKASEADLMREEITAVLSVAQPQDEVVVRLESGGGMVHAYGLAASQLARVKSKDIPLTVCVDKVAASGGYMMACVADKIIAAPFAILGSIGVVAQIPNIHRLLKKNDIDVELITAGEHKRTLTLLGENTDKGREKFKQDIQDTHELFKEFVAEKRPAVNLEEVANGDVWYGKRALDNALIDKIMTSDEYLLECCERADVYHIAYVEKHSLQERLKLTFQSAIEGASIKLWSTLTQNRFF